jgi:hypothetical protein
MSGGYQSDGFDDFFAAFLFHNVAAASGAQDAFGVKHFVVHGKNQNGDTGVQRLDVFDQFEAVSSGQGNVRKNEVWFEEADLFQCLARVAGFAANGHVGLAANEVGQAFTHHGMIVHDEDSGLGREEVFFRGHEESCESVNQ